MTPPRSLPPSPASSSPAKPKRPRGAQPGNLNALKHGFYTRRAHKRDLRDLESSDFQGLAEEIAILRLFTRRLVECYAPSSDLMETILVVRTLCFASTCLNRLIRTQHLFFGPGRDTPYTDAFEQVMRELTEELERTYASDQPSDPLDSDQGSFHSSFPAEEELSDAMA